MRTHFYALLPFVALFLFSTPVRALEGWDLFDALLTAIGASVTFEGGETVGETSFKAKGGRLLFTPNGTPHTFDALYVDNLTETADGAITFDGIVLEGVLREDEQSRIGAKSVALIKGRIPRDVLLGAVDGGAGRAVDWAFGEVALAEPLLAPREGIAGQTFKAQAFYAENVAIPYTWNFRASGEPTSPPLTADKVLADALRLSAPGTRFEIGAVEAEKLVWPNGNAPLTDWLAFASAIRLTNGDVTNGDVASGGKTRATFKTLAANSDMDESGTYRRVSIGAVDFQVDESESANPSIVTGMPEFDDTKRFERSQFQIDLRTYWNQAGGVAGVSVGKVDWKDVATLDTSFEVTGLNAEAMTQLLTGPARLDVLAKLLLVEAKVTEVDAGYFGILRQALRRRQGVADDEVLATIEPGMRDLFGSVMSEGTLRQTIDAIDGFIRRPGTLTMNLSPPEPAPLAPLLSGNLVEAARVLAPTFEYTPPAD